MSINRGMKRQREETNSTKRTCKRFTKKQVLVLAQWFEDHKDHPYPTNEEKMRLIAETSLTLTQVRDWLQHERNRYRAKLKKVSGHPQNNPVEKVNEENMENSMGMTIPIESESNVVPLNEVTTMDNAAVLSPVIDLNGTNRWSEKDEQSKNEWCWLKMRGKRLPESSVRVLEQWYEDHKRHPHPSKVEKKRLAVEANLTLTQVNDWFRNKRGKYDKKLKKDGGHPRNIPVEKVKEEENKENSMVTTISIESESNVVSLNTVTTIDNAAVLLPEINSVDLNELVTMDNSAFLTPEIIDFYGTFEQYLSQLV